MAGWGSEQNLCQLKLHLKEIAREVLPEVDITSYDQAVTALRKRFKPWVLRNYVAWIPPPNADQGDSSAAWYEIHCLGRKAFPSMIGKKFDRLLKRRFYKLCW